MKTINLNNINQKLVCFELFIEPDFGEQTCSHLALQKFPLLKKILKKYNIPLTIFLEGSIIESQHPLLFQLNNKKNDIQLHCYSHNTTLKNEIKNFEKNYNIFKNFFKKNPVGYKARHQILHPEIFKCLKKFNFLWDSTIASTFRHKKNYNEIYPNFPFYLKNSQIIEFPVSSWENFPFLLSLSYSRLIGQIGFSVLKKILKIPDILIYHFHLHDLFYIKSIKNISPFWKTLYYHNLKLNLYSPITSFEIFIKYLKKNGYKFITISELYNLIKNREKNENP